MDIRPNTCERRIAELRDSLSKTRAETDHLTSEALRLCRKLKSTIDVAEVQISVGSVQDALDRSYPRHDR